MLALALFLVIDGAEASMAAARTARPTLAGTRYYDRLVAGEGVWSNSFLVSRDARYAVRMWGNGTLGVQSASSTVSLARPAGPHSVLRLTKAGELVMYDRYSHVVWRNGVTGPDAEAVATADGQLVVYSGTKAIWSTGRLSAAGTLPAPPTTAVAIPSWLGSSTTQATATATPRPSVSTSSRPTSSPSATATPTPTPTPSATAPRSTPAPARPSSPPPPAPAPAVKGQRDPGLYPFSSTSAWNTPIGSGAVFEAQDGDRTSSLWNGAQPVVNSTSWSVSVAESGGSEPWSTLTSVRNGQSFTVQVPPGTVATAGSDKHITMVQADRGTAYDTYKAAQSGSNWTAQVAYQISLTGSGTGQGTRAASVPAMAGLIRQEEVQSNSIRHALAMALPGRMLKVGYVWPASSQDSDTSAYGGSIPMGSLVAIPGDVDVASLGLSPEGLALAQALQDYGVYVVDQAGTSALYAEQSVDPAKVSKLNAAWKQLYPHLRAVSNNSSATPGGGGTPRVPLLPSVG